MLSTIQESPVPAFPRPTSIRASTYVSAPHPLTSEQRLAVQLIHLASQFHASAYSLAKFGVRGAAMTYVPMSLHVPEYFQQLQARQALSSQEKAWWLYDRKVMPRDELVQDASLSTPVVTFTRLATDLQTEITAAIEAPLAAAPRPFQGQAQRKTSESHPINISTIVPTELLATISLHLTLSQQASPTMFDIHPAFSLDRITSIPSTPAHLPPPPPVPTEALPPPPTSEYTSSDFQPSAVSQFLWNRSSMKQALQSALASDIKTHTATPAPTLQRGAGAFSIPSIPPLQLPNCDILGEVLASADDSSIGLPQSVLGKHERAYSAPPAMFKAIIAEAISVKRQAQNDANGGNFPTPVLKRSLVSRNISVGPEGQATRPRLVQFSTQIRVSSLQEKPVLPSLSSNPPVLGNLFLSSCPGKKVRLNGPVHGRGPVCRDLRQDLQRMKALGVGCIVCCLDNEELDFLGAPWPEYSQAAQDLGLDVLRIPMPEGLAPASPAAFDAHLTRLITAYTLGGTHVLVHCRGGVGRAGLVACCWMLKLGLCAWPAVDADSASVGMGAGEVRRETLVLVERVIGIVRRRRSLKAIETYEQVKFLVGYVEYLREQTAAAAAPVKAEA
ncbi:phosphatases II [Dentipellis sp. KUC8613]|nr:phosphatases II [Dentipellis sp. KUC8613]